MKWFLLALFLLGSQASAQERGKVRGRIQDYQKYKYALVVYKKNHAPEARDFIRDVGFTVKKHERDKLAYRCTWTGLDRKELEAKLAKLASGDKILLIEPDPR